VAEPPEPDDPAWQARRARRQEDRRRVIRRRRLVALLIAGGLVGCIMLAFLLAQGGTRSGSVSASVEPRKPPPLPELPRGGRKIFPRYRIVAYYGAPQAPALGELGIGKPSVAARKLVAQMSQYRRGGRRLLPAMELIAVVAAGSAQQDGSYSYRQSDAVVRRYLRAARRLKALLILDIQPGHANFLDLARQFEPFLREPDVGLALDPEWLTPNAVPGTVIGSTDAATVNGVAAYLSGLVARYRLPEKLLVVHQFTDTMIRDKPLLRRHPGVALVLNVDGFGDPPNKIAKYVQFTQPRTGFRSGLKLFYHEDTNLMSPRDVLRLRPRPDLVIYE
jgi:hypothetical protein